MKVAVGDDSMVEDDVGESVYCVAVGGLVSDEMGTTVAVAECDVADIVEEPGVCVGVFCPILQAAIKYANNAYNRNLFIVKNDEGLWELLW